MVYKLKIQNNFIIVLSFKQCLLISNTRIIICIYFLISITYFRYDIPSRKVLSQTIIPNIFSKVKSKVQNVLNEASHVAVTTDIWTSLNTDSFITLTAHLLDKNQEELKTVVLCTKKLTGNHTANLLSEVITNELIEWNILSKVFGIVIDGGANGVKMVSKWLSN